jgi:putative methanogen marker protein 4
MGINDFLTSNQAELFLFGHEVFEQKSFYAKFANISELSINFISSDNPEKEIIESLKTHKIDGAIRGGLGSSKFLEAVKGILNVQKINRLALLETIRGYQFFFGPIGIDECNNKSSKILFLDRAIELLRLLDIEPNISILSGGRKGDLGRDSSVDESIKQANQIVTHFKMKESSLNICHDEILIENSITNKANLIIAPNGYSGNLIYRTLVHLGGGKAYGAIYLGLEYIIIDTSRVGDSSEIEGALLMASSLFSYKRL